MKGLTDVPGIQVGHATDAAAMTGCTVIFCGTEAIGGVDIRGSATGSCEIETLYPGSVDPQTHAILLTGGSAFGIEASWRSAKRTGKAWNRLQKQPTARCRSCPGPSLFDLPVAKCGVRPTREMGEKAVQAANEGPVAEGNVGAGTGASVE